MRTVVGKKLLYTGIACLVLGGSSLFAKSASHEALVYAESIKTLSQELAKNYFYVEEGIQVASAKKGLKKGMLALDEKIQKLQIALKDPNDKKVVTFMLFSMDELKDIMKEKFNAENGGLVLDYTETLLEGSASVAKHNKGKTDSMLDIVEEMEFLLERASKYYIAFRAGYTDDINIVQAANAVKNFEKLLKKVQGHSYADAKAVKAVKKLTKYWPASKSFYLGIKESELPTIVFISTKHMKKALDVLVVHHEKQER